MPPNPGGPGGRPRKKTQTKLTTYVVSTEAHSAPPRVVRDSSNDVDMEMGQSRRRASSHDLGGTSSESPAPTRSELRASASELNQRVPIVAELEHDPNSGLVDDNFVPLGKNLAVVVDSPKSVRGRQRASSKKTITPPSSSNKGTEKKATTTSAITIISSSEDEGQEESLFVRSPEKNEAVEAQPTRRGKTATRSSSAKRSKNGLDGQEDDIFRDDDGGKEKQSDQTPKPMPQPKKQSQPQAKPSFPQAEESADSEEEFLNPSKSKPAKVAKATKDYLFLDSDDEREIEAEKKSKEKGKAPAKVASARRFPVEEDILSDDEQFLEAAKSKDKSKVPAKVTSAGRFSSEEDEDVQEEQAQPQASEKGSKLLPTFSEDIYAENSDDEFVQIRADQARSKAKRHAFDDDSLAEEQIAAPLRKSKEKGSKVKASIESRPPSDDLAFLDQPPVTSRLVRPLMSSEPPEKKMNAVYSKRLIKVPQDDPCAKVLINSKSTNLERTSARQRRPSPAPRSKKRSIQDFIKPGQLPPVDPGRRRQTARASPSMKKIKNKETPSQGERLVILSDDDDDRSRGPSSSVQKGKKTSNVIISDSEGAFVGRRSNTNKRQREASTSADERSNSRAKNLDKGKKKKARMDDDYDAEQLDIPIADDDDEPPPARMQSDKRPAKRTASSMNQQDAPIAPMAPMMVVDVESDSGDEMPVNPSQATAKKKRFPSPSGFESPAHKRLKQQDRSRSRTNSKSSYNSLFDGDDDDDEPLEIQKPVEIQKPAKVPEPVKRRKLVQRSSQPQPAKKARLRKPGERHRHRSEREKAIELGKRRRAGENIDMLTESSCSSDDGPHGEFDTDDEQVALQHFSDESDAAIEEVRRSLRPTNRDNDDSDDDFIVADDEVELGVQTEEIPIQFTHHAHKKLEDFYKDMIEWHVMRIIHPAFDRDHEKYKMAFRKLDMEPSTLVNSKFLSSAWNEKFVHAIRARPDFESNTYRGGKGEERKCDACGKSSQTISHVVFLTGKPYRPDDLEPVDDGDSDSDVEHTGSASDATSASVDYKGHKLPKQRKKWYLGSTCHYNAENCHKLIHWKLHLDGWVEMKLQEEGYFDHDKMRKRMKWSEIKKAQTARDIVDEWADKEEGGLLKRKFNSFQNMIEAARNSEADRWGRERQRRR